MTNEVWQTIIQGIAVALAALGALRYLDERKEDRTWRKTQFLMELAKGFDAEERTRTAQRIFDGPKGKVHQLLTTGLSEMDSDDVALVHCIDQYFDFFDRLYTYVFVTKVLTIEESLTFSGYLDVLSDKEVVAHANTRGYGDVIKLGEAMDRWLDDHAED